MDADCARGRSTVDKCISTTLRMYNSSKHQYVKSCINACDLSESTNGHKLAAYILGVDVGFQCTRKNGKMLRVVPYQSSNVVDLSTFSKNDTLRQPLASLCVRLKSLLVEN